MVDIQNFNLVPNDDEEEFLVDFGEVTQVSTSDFNKLENRPSYNNTTMTGDTNIPKVPASTSELDNDSDFQTGTEVESAISAAIGAIDIPSKTSDLTNDGADGTSTYVEADDLAQVATTGNYNDLNNKPTIPAAQVNSDWNATSGVAEILNKPTIPTVNDATLTITQNGTSKGTFTANDADDTTIDVADTTYTAGNAIAIDNNNVISADIYPADFFTAPAIVTGAGSEIALQKTIPLKLMSVQLDGDTFQQTYSGINLLPPPEDFTQDVNGLIITCSNGEYSINGNASSGATTGVKSTIAEYTIKAGDYFHYNNDLVSSRINIGLRFSDNTQFATSMNVANRIISLEDYVGKTVIGVTVNFNSGYDFSGTAKPMILSGVSTVTPFEPYVGGVPAPNPDYPQEIQTVTGEQTVSISDGNGNTQSYTISLGATELCKIGDYQDYIYKSGDDWYVHKGVGKRTLTTIGSTYNTAGTGYIGAQIQIVEMAPNSRTNGYCNRLVPMNSPAGATTEGITFGAENSYLYMVLADTRMASSTKENWDAWLASNDTTVYYPLATSTDTKITDAGLITQLNAIKSAKAYSDSTNIMVTATGTNLPVVLEVAAYTNSLAGIVGYLGDMA